MVIVPVSGKSASRTIGRSEHAATYLHSDKGHVATARHEASSAKAEGGRKGSGRAGLAMERKGGREGTSRVLRGKGISHGKGERRS
eukprot:5427796-Pleurochrysis_carterae.AAC.1